PQCFEGLTNWRLHCTDEVEEQLGRKHKMKRSKSMDRMLVVVFDTEPKAYEGKKALDQLDDEGPLGTLVGTSVGALIGLLGGPIGVAIGASTGLVAGGTVDVDNARIGE